MNERGERHPLYTTPLEKWALFFLVFMGVLSITYGIFFLVDFLPEKPGAESEETRSELSGEETNESMNTNSVDESVLIDPLPVAIVFDSFDKRIPIINPVSTEIEDLNNALLKGVVRHPDSADFENEGTIFLFGHSSYLPTVINKNFQAFNGIQNLNWGDTVRLQSSDKEYVYRVDDVYQVSAADAEIEIERERAKLTLVTCNTFGTKEDRYIVEATLIDSYRI